MFASVAVATIATGTAAAVASPAATTPPADGLTTATVTPPTHVHVRDEKRAIQRAVQRAAAEAARKAALRAQRRAAARALAEAAARKAAAARERQRVASVPLSTGTGIAQVWLDVADCESSGNWRTNTGNGYYGGLQITSTNAAHYGFARADLLPPSQQVRLASLVLRDQGPGAWPNCGPANGLTMAYAAK